MSKSKLLLLVLFIDDPTKTDMCNGVFSSFGCFFCLISCVLRSRAFCSLYCVSSRCFLESCFFSLFCCERGDTDWGIHANFKWVVCLLHRCTRSIRMFMKFADSSWGGYEQVKAIFYLS